MYSLENCLRSHILLSIDWSRSPSIIVRDLGFVGHFFLPWRWLDFYGSHERHFRALRSFDTRVLRWFDTYCERLSDTHDKIVRHRPETVLKQTGFRSGTDYPTKCFAFLWPEISSIEAWGSQKTLIEAFGESTTTKHNTKTIVFRLKPNLNCFSVKQACPKMWNIWSGTSTRVSCWRKI